jgi:hypothetical protein
VNRLSIPFALQIRFTSFTITGKICTIPSEPSFDRAVALPFDSTQTIDEYNTFFIVEALTSALLLTVVVIATNGKQKPIKNNAITRLHLLVIILSSFMDNIFNEPFRE